VLIASMMVPLLWGNVEPVRTRPNTGGSLGHAEETVRGLCPDFDNVCYPRNLNINTVNLIS
jgi:hypothetical protein